MDLSDYRAEIDDIDEQLAKLFVKRIRAVDAVAEYKQATGMRVMQPARERAVLDRVAQAVPEDLRYYTENMFSYMMSLSRNRERTLISPHGCALERFLADKRDEKPNPLVAVRGDDGSCAAKAASLLCPGASLLHVKNFEQVFIDIRDDTVDYGVLPLDDPIGDTLNEVYELLMKYNFYIVRALPMKFDFYLLGVRGTKLSDVRTVCVHPLMLHQCSEFFVAHPRIRPLFQEDTAQAAEFVSRKGQRSTAVLAPRVCAHICGLDVLEGPLPQSLSGLTRFIAVSRLPEFREGADRISLVFKLPNVTGSLYRTLMRFALAGLSLTKIISRPCLIENDFEYCFYVDLKGSLKSSQTLSLLSQLCEELPAFHFLGNYPD